MKEAGFYYVFESQQSWMRNCTVRVCLQNISDYSPFGAPLDGRTIAYQPAPAPTPAVSVVYQHKFDDGPNAHPYTTLPSTLDAKLTNISWTNTQNKWTNFTGFTGKAIAIDSALADTTRLFLNLMVNSGYKLDVTSYSFYHRSSSTGYSNYKLYVNNKLVGTGTVFVSSSSSLQFTGTQNVLNAISGLTGNITVRLDLFGGLHGIAATFRMDNFTLNGYTQLIGAPNLLAKGYRFGFQGQERDDEISGKGNSYTADFWQYDSRLARRWNIDPILKEHESPYASFANNPIYFNDPDGKDAIITIDGNNITVSAKIYIMNSGKNKINVAKAQKAIMKYWGKEFTYTDEKGKKYNVKFDIKVMEANGTEDPNDASKNWVRPMDESFRSNNDALGGRYGKWAKNKDDYTYSHEVGHMLGLADQYLDFEVVESNLSVLTVKSFPENVDLNHPKDDIMGATSRHGIKPGLEKVDQSAIDAIAKYGLNRFKNKKTLNGKVILDASRLTKDGYSEGLNPPKKDEWELNERHKGYTPKKAHGQ